MSANCCRRPFVAAAAAADASPKISRLAAVLAIHICLSALGAPAADQHQSAGLNGSATGEQVANTDKLAQMCKTQIRNSLQLTNLSQLVFHPADSCSSWPEMLRAPDPPPPLGPPRPWLSVELLELSHNNLSVLHDASGLSRLVNLRELRIAHNKLTRCEEAALVGLERLHTLDLSHNKLVALPAKFLQPLRLSLRKLTLSFNSVSVLVPNLFDALGQLEHLDLSHNEITSHWISERLFKNLTQLHYLDLSFNKLTTFSSPLTFSSLQQLETLSLQHNELRQVPETIQHLRYLSNLDLSQNSIHDVANASYLSNCRDLFNLNLESNLIENITRFAFSDLPALKVLNLANNRIHQLDQQAFDFVPDLHALRLDSNRLTDFGQAFVNLRFLLMLNISSNRIGSFDYAQIPLGLQWLDLHSNKIDKLNNFYYSPSAQLQFTANDISSQQAVGSSISQQWQSMLRLTTLDVSFNLIKELDNTSLPESLETVQLNNNQIRNIASHTFSTKSNLTRINLSHNQLTSLPQDAMSLNNNNNRDTQTQTQMSSTTNGQKFVDIYLAANPLLCDCNTGWLSQLLLASSTLLQATTNSNNNLSGNSGLLREHQLILSRQLPRVADAFLVTCRLHFAKQQSTNIVDANQWSPVLAANQLGLQHNHHSHTRDTALVQRQSELLASVHLCPYKSHCIALCNCCDYDACDCEMICPENCSCYYGQTWSTNIVDCGANNQINKLSKPSSSLAHQHMKPQQVRFLNIPDKIPMDVTELYLDGLELLHLRGNALLGRRNLKSLYLNNSQIYSIEPRALATQIALKVLQLNSNFLTELHGYEFEQQVQLRELYLAYNQLTNIANTTFTPLRSLQVLQLDHNQLFQLNFWSNLPTERKLIALSLGANPWSCQCDQVEPMLQWLHLNSKHIHDRKSVSCQYNRTTSMHLMSPGTTTTTPTEDESSSLKLYASAGLYEQYQMFDMRMCLNFTVYPMIQSSASSSPSPLPQSIHSFASDSSSRDAFSLRPKEPTGGEDQLQANSNNSFIPSFLQPPNDEPFIIPSTARPYHQVRFQSSGSQFEPGPVEHIAPHGYQFPPSDSRNGLLSSPFLLGATSMILLLVIMTLSLIHYRRSMGMWFYSRYGFNMFAASKSHKHHSVVGSLGKHSQLHHHQHPHLHHHHHQCGASSAGSTSSSSAASSNLSQALCQQQQQQQSNATSGLVTTPLIVASNNHQLLSSSASTSSPYSDDEKLYDAYLTYSRLDEQFISEYIAPELEYGQPSYRVALHYRDLPVTSSEFLSECIVETANASRRVIMVLSEQLLKGEWNQFEFRQSLLDTLRSNYRHRLIVIILGQPKSLSHNADAELIQWLNTCTCIQWGDKMFWQRLRFAMPELAPSRQQHHQQQLLKHHQHQHYLRYQTLSGPNRAGLTGSTQAAKQKLNLGANLLKSAGGFLGGIGSVSGQQQQQQQQPVRSQQPQLISQSSSTTLHRPLPSQPTTNMILHTTNSASPAEEHHYAHLTPATMIYNQQQSGPQHTYHQPIYGDPQQQQQHQLQLQLQQQQQQQQQQQAAATPQPAAGRDNPTVPVHI